MLAVDWSDFLQSIPGILSVTFLFGGWIFVAVIGSLAKNWRKVHESEHLATLKQSMIERGMSAADIERVLRAGPDSPEDASGDAATELSSKLAEHGVPGPVMEQVLGAFRAAQPGTRKVLSKTVVAMLDNGAEGEQVLAAVRALSRTGPPEQPSDRRHETDPASFRH